MQTKFLTIALVATCLSAQAQPNNGLLPEDSTYEQLPLERERHSDVATPAESLRHLCPVPGDQGDMAACVGWALAHALTIMAKKANPGHRERFSASFIFNQIKAGDDCRLGAYLSAGLRFLQIEGVCLASTFPDSNEDCQRQPTPTQIDSARPYRIAKFDKLFDSGDSAEDKRGAVVAALSFGLPVVVGMNTPAGLRRKPCDSLDWKKAKTGHALVAVGYDETKKEVELMNSYGPDWCDGGFFHLSYDDFGRNLLYGYFIKIEDGFGKAAVSGRE